MDRIKQVQRLLVGSNLFKSDCNHGNPHSLMPVLKTIVQLAFYTHVGYPHAEILETTFLFPKFWAVP